MATHGTPSAYVAHYKAGEKPCNACKAGWSEYRTGWMERNPGKDEQYRLAAQASRVALRRLRDRHRGEYAQLRDEALQEAS